MALDRELVVEALPGYDVGDELGRGACGIVLRGVHRRLEREVAIKQLPRAFGSDPAQRRRFTAEAKLLASFDHPHIVPIFDYVEHEGLCLLVMERLTGGTLWDRTKDGESVSAPTACAITVAAGTGLHYAHERGTLHRDVKPENLMFSSAGMLKVTDFGIAKVVGSMTMATQAGYVIGTPAYIAPEQAKSQTLSPATDVYALGTVLYEMLAGRLPYPEADDPVVFLYQHVHEDPRPLEDAAPAVPPEIARVVDRAIRREPAARYATAEELGTALVGAAQAAWGTDWLATTGVRVMADGAIRSVLSRGSARIVAGSAASSPMVPSGDAAPSRVGRAAETVGVDGGSPEAPIAPVHLPPTPAPRRRRRGIVLAGIGLVLVGAGVAAALTLAGGQDGDPVATVPTTPSTSVASPSGPTDDELAEQALLVSADLPADWTVETPAPGDEPVSDEESRLAAEVRECAGAPRDETEVEVRGARFVDPTGALLAESRASMAATAVDARTDFDLYASGEYLNCLSSALPTYVDDGVDVVGLTRITGVRARGLDVTGYLLETRSAGEAASTLQQTFVFRRGRLVQALNLVAVGGAFPDPVRDQIASAVSVRLAQIEQ